MPVGVNVLSLGAINAGSIEKVAAVRKRVA